MHIYNLVFSMQSIGAVGSWMAESHCNASPYRVIFVIVQLPRALFEPKLEIGRNMDDLRRYHAPSNRHRFLKSEQ
jgi:hypothetical protein